MKNKSMGIALMGEDVLKGSFPAFITENATSLIRDISDTEVEHDLERLIRACCHLRHVHIATNRVLHIPLCIPRPLEQLSYFYMKSPKSVSPDELIALLRFVPNVRRIAWLPRTSDSLDKASGPLGPLALRTLNVYWIFNTSVLLAPLLTHRWSVRTLILSVDPTTLQVLRRCGLGPGDLPTTHDLTLNINEICKDETAPLHTLIAACHLRRLTVDASAEKTSRLLATAPGICGGLRALSLVLDDFEEDREDFQELADTLVAAIPRALRSLELFILPLYSHMFNALRSLCRYRRIVLNIKSI